MAKFPYLHSRRWPNSNIYVEAEYLSYSEEPKAASSQIEISLQVVNFRVYATHIYKHAAYTSFKKTSNHPNFFLSTVTFRRHLAKKKKKTFRRHVPIPKISIMHTGRSSAPCNQQHNASELCINPFKLKKKISKSISMCYKRPD